MKQNQGRKKASLDFTLRLYDYGALKQNYREHKNSNHHKIGLSITYFIRQKKIVKDDECNLIQLVNVRSIENSN